MQIGESRLAAVVELPRLVFPRNFFLETFDDAVIARHMPWLAPHYYEESTESLLLSHHAWLIDTGRYKILVDPCVGNHKTRRMFAMYNMLDTPWLDRLADAGATPKDIDFVLCTHLHVDHCGWNTKLENGRWVPTFPNAQYVFSVAEHDYWSRELRGIPLEEANLFNSGVFADSVLPVIQSGQAMIVHPGTSIFPGFDTLASDGHTPGHIAAVLDCGEGDGILFAGDAIHHPLQIVEPDWNTKACFDPAQARASRRALLERAASDHLLVAPAHFRGHRACRVEEDGPCFSIFWPSGEPI